MVLSALNRPGKSVDSKIKANDLEKLHRALPYAIAKGLSALKNRSRVVKLNDTVIAANEVTPMKFSL